MKESGWYDKEILAEDGIKESINIKESRWYAVGRKERRWLGSYQGET